MIAHKTQKRYAPLGLLVLLLVSITPVQATTLTSCNPDNPKITFCVEFLKTEKFSKHDYVELGTIVYTDFEIDLHHLAQASGDALPFLCKAIEQLSCKSKSSTYVLVTSRKLEQTYHHYQKTKKDKYVFQVKVEGQILTISLAGTTLLNIRQLEKNPFILPSGPPQNSIKKTLYMEDWLSSCFRSSPLQQKINRLYPYPDVFVIHFRPVTQYTKQYKKAFKIAQQMQSGNPQTKMEVDFKEKGYYHVPVRFLWGKAAWYLSRCWGFMPEEKYLDLRLEKKNGKMVKFAPKRERRLVNLLIQHKISPEKVCIRYRLLYYPDLLLSA
ncbi:MAG: hypothetical protein ACPGC9_01815 [Cytophagales bacterium]